MKILILGNQGMLGKSVTRYYQKQRASVRINSSRWPQERLKDTIATFNGDLIINCIGAIPQKTQDFKVNYELPFFIANNMQKGVKYIHPDTDCIFRGDLPKGEFYDKCHPSDATDEYGTSKSFVGELESNDVKLIRSSIVGLDGNGKSLLSWFLSQQSVKGYTNHYWNGITVHHWAKVSKKIFDNWKLYGFVTQVASNCISKAELLKAFNRAFGGQIKITEVEHETTINRCLLPDIKLSNIETQLKEYIKEI